MNRTIKTAAIWNVWDGIELLPYAFERVKAHIGEHIVVYQNTSNYGEPYPGLPAKLKYIFEGMPTVTFVEFEPIPGKPMQSEMAKRNLGLDLARKLNCSHFLFMDVDELYEDFAGAKRLYFDSGAQGSVCKMRTYFKEPTLMYEQIENYYVPFIHELHWDTRLSLSYPFYVDPTRRVVTGRVVELPIFMHHFSWVRNDIDRKIRNSTAKRNIEKGHLREDWENAKEGSFVRDYNTKLLRVENKFGIYL